MSPLLKIYDGCLGVNTFNTETVRQYMYMFMYIVHNNPIRIFSEKVALVSFRGAGGILFTPWTQWWLGVVYYAYP